MVSSRGEFLIRGSGNGYQRRWYFNWLLVKNTSVKEATMKGDGSTWTTPGMMIVWKNCNVRPTRIGEGRSRRQAKGLNISGLSCEGIRRLNVPCELLIIARQYLYDPDNPNGVITHLGPDILEYEVKWALGSITMNKVSGGDGIAIELFQILKDDAVEVLHSICQQI